jgi:hypothetical protein
MRPAQSRRPATYRCPFCGERLHAMSAHVLIAPEGDVDRRRHAHLECVRRERAAGRLPTQDEARPPGEAGIVRRLWRRFGR